MISKGYKPQDREWMLEAMSLAEQAGAVGEVPVGALLVRNGSVIGRGWNCSIGDCDPTAHAEIVALRDAARSVSNYRLPDTTLYVTIEPCTMCVGAMIHARIGRLVYGASEPRAGAVVSQLQLTEQTYFNHRIEVIGGLLAEQCGELVSQFFRQRRKQSGQSGL
ncbi:tRNA adenosine(34) deaminase TadA [Porticoccus hydrocarbonoclasticus]|jgi:tRNA(adenine34) deaminase|uniref:tRNA adenosine(34) deaminase TadA n=1 Tax=Porticoccus hydrocarbonoclasticus TaxID=1073414 RepID=UPI002357F5AF|nr:tRNA adenosine(34) deaminase TadA [Porticoccus hydrocarbonoclasticus]|tara:strand:+ start:2646 stop:3137 length:492 start_codon:yes stop_codon:yes gene_type:complete